MSDLIHGFELIEERHIEEIDSKARLFRHARTGAELVSVENNDENKSFMISFKTPPDDDTGLPHIMEHSVLAGSRKYPVKEPFVEMYKTSLNTFLNAMTRSDSTVYPVASANLQDFYNLVDVYLDAVFYPRIDRKTLMRQGWHYETSDEDAPLDYKGVVFNEMKGYYSTPDILLSVETQAALLPDTPYANSSGGDPQAMPDLTYEQFKSFHETLYHPSNARIFFYGDDNPEDRLRRIDEFITEFKREEVDADLPLQESFDKPRFVTKPYDSGEFGADSNKAMVTVSWLLPEIHDHATMLQLKILSQALVGSSASPLRKALIDSGLGEDIVGGGFSSSNRQAVFSTGLKGIAADDAKQVETLILDTLGTLADDGLTPETIDAAINKIEFNLRERNSGGFPRGLVTAMQILPTWLHGGNPLNAIEFEDTLADIKAAYDDNPQHFENLIGEYFLDNPHRSTVVLTPDPEMGKRRDAKERDRLDKARAGMNAADIQQIMATQEQLRIEQDTPNTPEELATIPTLTLDDIEREITTVPTDISESHGATIYYHDLPTAVSRILISAST